MVRADGSSSRATTWNRPTASRWPRTALLAAVAAVAVGWAGPALAQADLSVVMTDSPDPVDVGATLSYALVVTNAGPDPATNAVVALTLDSDLAYAGATAPGWSCNHAAGVVTCTRASLSVSTSNLTVTASAPATPAAISSSATVSSATADPSSGNNSSGAVTTTVASADLSLAMVDAPDPVDGGDNLTFTVSVTNGGPDRAASVAVAVTLDAALSYVSAGGTGWTCGHAAGVVTCTRATLNAGTAPNIAIVTTAPAAAATLSTSASVSSATYDPDSADTSDVEATTVVAVADLGVTLSDSPDPVQAGQTLTHTIEVTNHGPHPAPSVAATTTLDSALAFVAASGTGWSCGHAAGVVTCTRASLAVAATSTVTVTSTAPANGTTVTTAASVSSAGRDDVPGNDGDSDDTVVTPRADLVAGVNIVAASAVPGQTRLTATVTVTNSGPSDVVAAEVAVPLPAFLAGIQWSCAITAGSGACHQPGGAGPVLALVDLDAAATATLSLAAWVDADAGAGSRSLTATATAPAGTVDPTAGNDSASDTVTLNPQAILSVSKSNGIDALSEGQSFTYSIVVSNAGPSADAVVTVADTFPAQLNGHPGLCGNPATPCWTCQPGPALAYVARAVEGQAGVSGLEGARALAISPDGLHVYVAGGADDSLVVFTRTVGPAGGLSYAGTHTGVAGAAGLAISPDGAHVYATAATSNRLVVFSRNLGSGLLTQLEVEEDGVDDGSDAGGVVDGLLGPRGVVVSPDGAQVYVTSPVDGAVATFSRAADGRLSFVTASVHGDLAGAARVAVSGDGASLYVAATDADAVVGFVRDRVATSAGFGTLSGRQAYLPSGFSEPSALAVSGDGAHVYVTGRDGVRSAVLVMSRSAAGVLSEVQRSTSAVDGASDVAVSPDGGLVMVTAAAVDAVTVLQRTVATGQLALLGAVDVTQVDGLGAATSLAVTPDGSQVVVTGEAGGAAVANAAVALAMTAGASCTASGSGSIATSAFVPAGASVVYTVAARVVPGTTVDVCNTATVSGLSADSDQDCDPVTLATDLEVVTSDGVTAATPGEELAATVTVTNRGTLNVAGARVDGSFPVFNGGSVLAGFTAGSVAWSCVASGGACCTSGTSNCGTASVPVTGSGDIVARLVDLPPGAAVVFSVNAEIHPSATGTLANSVTATMPAGVGDPNLANNTGADLDTALQPVADLVILKQHGPVSGSAVTYAVTVDNLGPSTAVGATVQDAFPPGLSGASWSCTATGGGSCTTATTAGNLLDTVTVPPGATLSYQVNATLVEPAPDPVVVNTASVTGGSAVDPSTSNNTATDQLVLAAAVDLTVQKTDGRVEAVPGNPLTYVITVTNAGPDAVVGARVLDPLPADLVDVSWSCDATPPVPGEIAPLELFSLAGAQAAAVSPDGAHVYAVGAATAASGQLTAYTRSSEPGPLFGKLGLLATIDQGGVAALAGASAVVVSGDGRHVYVASAGSNAVLVFTRDWNPLSPSFGALTAMASATMVDGVGGVNGLAGAAALALSPDGAHLYVAGAGDDAVAVFERSAASGALDWVEVEVDGAGSSALAGAAALAVSPDGAHLYVSGADDAALAVFSRDAGSGELSWREDHVDGSGGVTDLVGASAVVVSPDGAQVYVAAATDGAVVAFQRDTVASSGGFGSLSFDLAYPGTTAVPPAALNNLAGVSGIHLTGDGQHLIAAATAADSLVVFRRNTGTGLLTYQELLQDGAASVDGLQGVGAVTSSADGAHLYTAAAGDGRLGVFSRRQPDPAFAFVEAEVDGVDDPADAGGTVDGLLGARDLAVTPDGQHVIAVGFADDKVAVFARDAGEGSTPASRALHLSFQQAVSGSDLDGAGAVVVTTGNVYVAAEISSAVVVLNRNPLTGALTAAQTVRDGVGGVDGLSGASSVALSPGGNHLYVAGQFDAAVAIFAVTAGSGQLTYAGLVRNGVNGVEGLSGVSDLAVSADGRHLYAVSRTDDAVVVFNRATGGGLSYAQSIRDGQSGSDGLDRAMSVAVSADGGHVYVAGANDNAIATFRRNSDETSPSFGRLIFSGVAKDGVNGVDGLAGARSVQVSHDGRRVVAVGEFDHALAIFARIDNPTSPAFGSLSPIETRFDGVDGVNGLAQANGVALSADGRHTYVAAFGDHAVSAFIRRSGSRCSAGGTGSIDDEVDIGFGGSVVYTVAATVRPGATGSLTNTVTVTVPAGITDLVPSDNAATDTDLLTPESDLAVAKSDGASSVAAGGTVSYAITVTNAGPSDARQALVSDLFGADFTSVDWTCRAVGSGSLSEVAAVTGLATLVGPSAVAVSPDPDGGGPLAGGTHVYVAGFATSSLAVFARDPFSGALSLVEVEQDGVGGVDGLAGASAVAVSPLGDYVFVGGQLDDAVAVFARNPADGVLTYQMRLRDGVAGVDGLDQVTAIAVSADGSRLYVAGANDDAVAILGHAAGLLTFIGLVRDGVGGVDGLDGASGLALSPDGTSLYATGFNDGAVAVFEVAGGGLTFVERKNVASTSGLAGASAVAVSPSGSQVYVAGASDAAVVAFSRNASTGALTPLEVELDGVAGVEGLAGARALVVSDDGLHLYAAVLAVDSVVLFRRDAVTGRLDFAERLRDGVGSDSLNGVGGLALSPAGDHLYATAFADDAVVALARSADSDCPASGTGGLSELVDVAAGGRLEFTATAVLRSDAVGTPCPAPDADRQCVVNTATVAPPAASRPDPVTADNTAVDVDFLSRRADLAITKDDGLAEVNGLGGATAIAVDPLAGAAVYVAGPTDSGIAVFTRATAPGGDFGRLDFASFVRDGVDGVDGLGGVAGLALSQDGAHLYAAGASDSAVAAFARAADGHLTPVEVERNGIGGVSGLLGAAALALSGDDHHLYVVGGDDNAVAAFRRDSASSSADFGELSYLATVEHGVAGAGGLERPSAVAVSPDGGHVYITGSLQGTVAVLARNRDAGSSGFGQLTYLEHHRDGVAGVDGLAGAAALAVDDDFVYVAGAGDGAVAVFARDSDAGSPTFGRLSFVTSSGAVPGLAGVRGLALSPTPGDHLYAAAASGDALAVFGRDSDPGSGSYGALTLDAVIHDGDLHGGSPVEGLSGPAALVVSADGEHVYVAAASSGAAVAFTRDSDPLSPELGELSFLEAQGDGSGGAPPGSDVTYIITVSNVGPSNVVNAQVSDLFPVEFDDVSWVCSTQGVGASCDTPSGVGDLDEEVDLPVGGLVIFEATGSLRPGVSGTLSNTATVAPPPGVIDPALGNNSATDDNTLLAALADLTVSKDDGLLEVVAGQAVTYTMVVANLGPSHAAGVRVSDRLPEAIHAASWSCVADPEPGLLSYVAGESDGAAGVDGLDGVAATAVSHDGSRVFSVAAADHALAVFRRDLRNGQLEYLGAEVDGSAGVDGLAGASALVVSPDDRHVYVAGSADDAVAAFAVDGGGSSGVSFVELERDGVAGVNGLGGVADLALSADGASLYAAGTADSAVAVFDRSSASGELSLREVKINGLGGVSGLGGVAAVAVSPNGSHVYAAAPGDDAVAVFQRAGNGSLSFLGRVRDGFDGIPAGTLLDPVDLAVSTDGAQLLVTALASDALVVFDRDASTGALSFADAQRDGVAGVSGLGGARSVVESSDGGQVYVAGEALGSVAVFRRAGDGGLSFVAAVSGASPGFGPLEGLRPLAARGEGRHLSAAAAAIDSVAALARHPGSVCTTAGSGDLVDTVDIAPGGSLTYRLTGVVAAGLPATTTAVVNEVVVTVPTAVVDPDRANNRAEDVDALVARADLAVSKDDGLTVVRAGEPISYAIAVTNLGPSDVAGVTVSDLVPVYPVDPAGLAPASVIWGCAGEAPLAVVASHVDGVGGVNGLAATSWVVVRPDFEASGRELVFATGAGDDAVAVFARSTVPGPGFGQLTFLAAVADGDVLDGGTVNGLAGAAGLALSGDGSHLYVAGGAEAALAVLAIDATSGDLDFVEAEVNGVDGVDGLTGATSVAVSPDGSSVYVTGRDADAVVVFARAAATGALTYVEREKEGFGDVPLVALDGARHVVVAPDGSSVYVAAEQADAVVSFARDAVTGALDLVEVVRNLDLRDGVTVNGLDFIRSLAISHGGEHLYAASLADDAVVVFERDLASGRLRFLEVHRNGLAGVAGLDGATAVALSDDGGTLAVVGLNSDAVAAFTRDWASGRLTPLGSTTAASLDGAAGLAFSPDGSHLLVSAQSAGALNVVVRRPQAICPLGGSGAPVAATLDLAAGASVTLTVSGVVHPSARGTLVNSVSVAPPPGVVDSAPGNDSASDTTTIEVVSDLLVSKSNGVSSVVAGLPVSYAVVVANRGPSDAHAVTVQDLLPAELQAAQWTCLGSPGSACAAGPVAGNVLDAASVVAGGSVTYTVTATVAATAAGTLVNSATAALAVGTDPTPADLVAVDTDAIVRVTNLGMSKGNGVTSVVPGTAVSYTIVAANAGPSHLAVGTVRDTLSPQLLGATWTCAATSGSSCSASGSGSIVDPVAVAAQGSVTYTITATVAPAATGTLANTASIEAQGGATDPVLTDNVAADSDPLTPQADLALAIDDDLDPAVTGHPLVYTLTVTNGGPSTATGGAATTVLPAGVTLVDTIGCSQDPSGVPTCGLGTLAPGAVKVVTVAVTINEGVLGTVVANAAVAATTPDPVPANNSGSETTVVEPWADLAAVKVDATDPVVAGTDLSYTITVTNNSPYPAPNVVVSDSLPVGVSPLGTVGCAEDGSGGGIPTCTLGTIAAGGHKSYTLTVEVDSTTLGTMVNDADVASPLFDPDLGDNVASASTTVVAEADLWASKDNGQTALVSGQAVTYTVTIGNDGPSHASAADVVDAMPSDLLGVSWACTPSVGAFCAPSGLGNLLLDTVELAVGSSVSYVVNATVDPLLANGATVTNTVTVDPAGALTDPNAGDNTATDADAVDNLLFEDGFESGDSSRWSTTQPPPLPPPAAVVREEDQW